jgi:hypothetical protein
MSMKIRNIAIVSFIAALLAACLSTPPIVPTKTISPITTFTPVPTATRIPVTPTEQIVEYQLEQEIQIRLGESITLENGALTIRFKSLAGDSRCPEGVVCVWQGNAEVILDVSGNEISLNTALEPKEAVMGTYTIRLQDVFPYPKMDEAHAPEDYSIEIIVSRN